ncbi:MAG: GntR family transcriptional regulator [Tissierellia bacterium]|nr:GntR family transcriptional regulator [Tissierellia bacterium]
MIRNSRKKMKDVAYSAIRDKILSGELAPGTNIVEGSMAKELGISRTPVREAIVMLEADGFIQVYPNKGPMVPGLSVQDLIWITQIREGLEAIAARIACDMPDKSKLIELRGKLLSLDNLKDETQKELGFKYGRKIHAIIINSTGNRRMIRILENMRLQLHRLMILSRLAPQRAEVAFEQHISILNAVIEGDHDEAERSIRNHIRSVTNDAIKVFQQEYI